jgi:hypothetical protein
MKKMRAVVALEENTPRTVRRAEHNNRHRQITEIEEKFHNQYFASSSQLQSS